MTINPLTGFPIRSHKLPFAEFARYLTRFRFILTGCPRSSRFGKYPIRKCCRQFYDSANSLPRRTCPVRIHHSTLHAPLSSGLYSRSWPNTRTIKCSSAEHSAIGRHTICPKPVSCFTNSSTRCHVDRAVCIVDLPSTTDLLPPSLPRLIKRRLPILKLLYPQQLLSISRIPTQQ